MPKMMKQTTVTTAFAAVIFTALYHILQQNIFEVLAITFATTFYHFAMRLIVGEFYDRLIHNEIDPNLWWFQPHCFEPKLYCILRVKKWKKKIPTYVPEFFSLQNRTPKQVAMAMCQAELVHETIIPLSFLPLIASVWVGSFSVFLITSVLAGCFDLMFVIIQRYNRPRIMQLHKKYLNKTSSLH